MSKLSVGVALGAIILLVACNQQQTSKAPAPEGAPAPKQEAEATSTATPSEAKTALRQFETKTGRVTFAMTGLQTGTETMTWDDWGARQVTETKATTSMGGTSIAQNRRTIIEPDTMMMVDDTAKTVVKIDRTQTPLQPMNGQNMREMSEDMLKSMGATKEGADTIVGKTCDQWKMPQMGMTICSWKGLPLKTEVNMGPMKMFKVATAIDQNVSVKHALFEVPADYQESTMPTGPGPMGPMPQGMPQMPAPPSNN